jgi:DNA-binding response OmpR family regulator
MHQEYRGSKIAIIEPDTAQRESMAAALQALGFTCRGFRDRQSYARAAGRETFDLMIVDWEVPTQEPHVVLWARERQRDLLPVILLMKSADTRDIVFGLECGAAACMRKPVRLEELGARVQSLLRRPARRSPPRQQVVGDCVFDPDERSARISGVRVVLNAQEYALATTLFANVGRLVLRQHLIEAVWGPGMQSPALALKVLASVLRKKLNLRPGSAFQLSAVYGVGYRLERETPTDPQPPNREGGATYSGDR